MMQSKLIPLSSSRESSYSIFRKVFNVYIENLIQYFNITWLMSWDNLGTVAF